VDINLFTLIYSVEEIKMMNNKWIWGGIVVVVAVVLWQWGIFTPSPGEVTTG